MFLRHSVVCIISPNSAAFAAFYVKVVEDTQIHSASAVEITPNGGVKVKRPFVASKNHSIHGSAELS